MARRSTIELLASLTHGAARIVDARDGWPSLVDVVTTGGSTRIAAYAREFALRSYRKRDHLERRMQNPGQSRPVVAVPNAVPVILGLWTEGPRPVVVAFEAPRRFDRATRQSFFASLPHLAVAAARGWTSHKSVGLIRFGGQLDYAAFLSVNTSSNSAGLT